MDEIIELDSDTECSITEPSISIDLDSDNESSSIVGSILPSSKSSAEGIFLFVKIFQLHYYVLFLDVSQTSREFDQSYPVWIDDFNKKCLEIVGTKCSKKLDILMDKYLM